MNESFVKMPESFAKTESRAGTDVWFGRNNYQLIGGAIIISAFAFSHFRIFGQQK